MQKLQKTIVTAVLMSEISHVFCCVLPILFSVFSLMAGMGVIGVMPQIFTDIHDVMHAYEVPMIITSGIILLFGWVLYFISRKMDCHDTGCGHGPCEPRKANAHLILKIATVLFMINITVYATFHRDAGVSVSTEQHHGHEHHDHQ